MAFNQEGTVFLDLGMILCSCRVFPGLEHQHQQDCHLPQSRRQLRRAGDHDADPAADDSHFPGKNRTSSHV